MQQQVEIPQLDHSRSIVDKIEAFSPAVEQVHRSGHRVCHSALYAPFLILDTII